ncbi:MAG: ATP-dependent RecD-like DNA helicase [Christensenellaceae bacterium]|jgi:exodeoxyribonuclease V alpha subunit|nr:ATP-dependent RecD-like DNA helicase [Christensenellaceae bacterium]
MKLSGVIEDVVYKNSANGYTVLNIDVEGILVTCVGKSANINEGEFVELEGEYTKSNKYGEQFSFSNIKISDPVTADGIIRYLSSGLIKGVGPVTAEAIVKKFGKDTLSIIEFSPERLTEVRGVSENKAQMIGEAFSEIKNMQRAIMFLQDRGITTNMAVKLFNIYNQQTVDVISQNPYKLIEDIDGVGFLTADRIASNLGVAPNSEFRVRAAILHTLKEAADKGGNTFLFQGDLCGQVLSLINLEVESGQVLVNNVLENLSMDNVIKQFESKGRPVVMLSRMHFMENAVAKKLTTLNANGDGTIIDLSAEIELYEKQNKITLHSDQKEAVTMAVNCPVSVITGGPGTGKTTIIKCILNFLKAQGKQIYLLAPTGRAAKRLSQSCGVDASTIHRALEVRHSEDDSNSIFVHNEKNKLPADVIIIDEVSMVDIPLAFYLFRSLKPTCKLILVGDKDQLPSVGAGNVLFDLLKSEVIKSVSLTQIYRQDEDSLIVTNAHLINNGKMPEFNNKSKDFFFEEKGSTEDMLKTVIDLVLYRLPKYTGLESAQIQVLAAMKSGVCGVNNLNQQLQMLINPQSVKKAEIALEHTTYRVGDKVMQMSNNYNRAWFRLEGRYTQEGEGVFNGDMGKIILIDFQTYETTVEFEDGRIVVYPRNEITELSICYATTIHKSQGSEFDVVVIPVVAGSRQIITRNLLYTAVTRAKKIVVLVGSRKNIAYMIHNNYTASRNSMLCEFLKTQKKKADFLYGE